MNWLTRTALRLACATCVVAVGQAVSFVLDSATYTNGRPANWAIETLLMQILVNLGLGLVPLVIAMLIAAGGRGSLRRQITAVTVANVVGAVGYFFLTWGSWRLTWPLLLLGLVAYGLALLARSEVWAQSTRSDLDE